MKKHHSRKCTSKSSALLKIQNRGGVTGEPDFGCGERAVCSQRVYCARERDVSRDRLMSKEEKCRVKQLLSSGEGPCVLVHLDPPSQRHSPSTPTSFCVCRVWLMIPRVGKPFHTHHLGKL